MNSDLTREDYETILKYYKIKIPTNLKKLKSLAEDVLANKLCRCIKKVKKTTSLSEKATIAVCNNSIFKKRKLKYNKFSCKNEYKLLKNRKTRRSLSKIGKIKFNKTRKSR